MSAPLQVFDPDQPAERSSQALTDEVFASPHLSAAQKVIFYSLRRCLILFGARPPIGEIAGRAGAGVSTVYVALKRLEALGFVQVERDGRGELSRVALAATAPSAYQQACRREVEKDEETRRRRRERTRKPAPGAPPPARDEGSGAPPPAREPDSGAPPPAPSHAGASKLRSYGLTETERPSPVAPMTDGTGTDWLRPFGEHGEPPRVMPRVERLSPPPPPPSTALWRPGRRTEREVQERLEALMLRLAEEERQRAPLPPAPPPPAPKPTPPPANPLGLPRPLASRPKRPTPADGALRRRAAEVLGAFCADPSAGVAALVEFLAVDVAREGQNPLTRDFLTRHVRVFAEGRLPIGDLTEAIMDTIDHARAPGHYLSKSLANLTRTPRQTTIPALTEARTP